MAISCPIVIPGPVIGPRVVPGGDQCQVLAVECVCVDGVASWGVPATACVANDLCPAVPAYTCTPKKYTLQIRNGCLAGVPLAVEINPPCIPGCCDPLNGCLIVKYECYCDMAGSTWQPIFRDCVLNTDSRCDEDANTSTSTLYQMSIPDGCTVGAKVPATPVPPLTADCCGTCALNCMATCTNGTWTVTCSKPTCETSCSADGSWQGDAASCLLTQTLCGFPDRCTDGNNASCNSAENTPEYPDAPAAPDIGTRPCCFPPPTYCIYTWVATCSGGAWAFAGAPATGNCMTYCVETDWTPTDSCSQQKVTCEVCPSGQFC